MIRFNANLYRLATVCQSNEETRYYLQGVNVEPHAVKGVILTATNGHALLCVHDETGFADETAIITLSPAALKECKPGRGERRDVVVSTGAEFATVNITEYAVEEGSETWTDKTIATSHECRIDGTFPDYRRVIPQTVMILEDGAMPACFDGNRLAALSKVCVEFEKHFDRLDRDAQGVTRVLCTASNSPALVVFAKVPEAFGVIMPCRSNSEQSRVPAWLNAKPEAQSAAA